jgi:hypothetical protein
MKTNKQQLDKILPLGLLATRQYLLSQGVKRHTFDNAVKSGKLLPVCRGVYIRDGLPLTWQAVMASLNALTEFHPVYIGGVSALELSGLGHFVNDLSVLHVYSFIKKPTLLTHLDLSLEFIWHGTTRIWQDSIYQDNDIFTSVQWRQDVPAYLMASVEQACLEVLADVPEGMSFEYADALFQGLSSLSPRKLDFLLKQCKSIKVKRLFFWFAKRHGFSWFKHLNINDYDLGSGKRRIAMDGVLDKELLITVPNLDVL